MIELFEDITQRPDDPGDDGGTDVSDAFNQVLDEVDDIARATLGSITLTTMLKLIDRNRAREDSGQRNALKGTQIPAQ